MSTQWPRPITKPRTPRVGHSPRTGPVRVGHHGRSGPGNRSQHRDKRGARERTVGHYLLGRTLGEGSFGKVRLGTHILTGENVAVKILEKSRLVEAADVQRVAREIKILKRNRHQNIIQLFEVLDTPTAIYLIMENADAGEMFNYIVQKKRVDELQACHFFHQIIDGAEYLHNMEVTHRDLKPENLLLQHSADGLFVKIVDFGLSNTHDGGALLQTACGSPCYAAPEMIAGLKYWGPKADIWSMGVILYALVCGYLPFEDCNTSVLYKKIMAGNYACPNWISAEVRDLISLILKTDPSKRITISEIRKHRWYLQISRSQEFLKTNIPNQPADVDTFDPFVLAQIESIGIRREVVEDALERGLHNNATTTYFLLRNRYVRSAESAAAAKLGTLTTLNGRDLEVPEQKLKLSHISASPDVIPKFCLSMPGSSNEPTLYSTADAACNPPSIRTTAAKRPASAGGNIHVSQTVGLEEAASLDTKMNHSTGVSAGSSGIVDIRLSQRPSAESSQHMANGNQQRLFVPTDHRIPKCQRPSSSARGKQQYPPLPSKLHQYDSDTISKASDLFGQTVITRFPLKAKPPAMPRQPNRPNTRQRNRSAGSRAAALNAAVR